MNAKRLTKKKNWLFLPQKNQTRLIQPNMKRSNDIPNYRNHATGQNSQQGQENEVPKKPNVRWNFPKKGKQYQKE